MGLKSRIKPFIPPILAVALQGSRTVSSWEEACRSSNTYDTAQLNAFREARSAGRQVDGSLLAASVLGLLGLMIEDFTPSVTDFGGATGDLGADFLQAFPKATYTVVETETMANLMHDKSAVQFATTVPVSCDIFYSSGTLQYLDDPLSVLAAGLESARRFVALVRNSFSEREIFQVQVSKLFDNGVGPIPTGFSNRNISYPHRTLKESAVVALAASKGFRCISRLEETSGALGESYGRQLVFERANGHR